MLGKDWTREYFNDYVIWLEDVLYAVLSKNNQNSSLEEMKKNLTSIKVKNKDIQKDQFLEFLSEKNQRNRTEEQAFLININYIDNNDMNQYYLELIKRNKISVDQKEQIKGLKLLLSEFLYQCGYDDALGIQMNLLNQNNETHNELSEQDKKVFENIELKYNNGDIEKVIIFYGEKRGCTTWYIKNDKKVYRKIMKNNKGEFVCGKGENKAVIRDKDVIDYISKDYI